MSFPLRVDCYELIPDSGGQGKYRGGLGTRRAWTVLENTARATVCMERTKSPFGVAGGGTEVRAKPRLKTPTARNASSQARGLSMSRRRPSDYGGARLRRLRRLAGAGRGRQENDLKDGYITGKS